MLSGGIDSTVCAAIGRKALKPEQITAIHINNGFMRKKESESTIEALNKLDLNSKYVLLFRFPADLLCVDVAAVNVAHLQCPSAHFQ